MENYRANTSSGNTPTQMVSDAVRERLEVGSLIAEVARLVEFELRARGWRLQIEVADGLPAISGDAVQIQQVLLNLIRNGLEAMADQAGGDSVEVCAMPADDGGVEITVRDGGPGVPAAVEDRLFEPFYTTKTQGMGLGLSICQSIMAAHGGGLHYRRGEPGQGATFVMRLPVALAIALAMAAGIASSPISPNPLAPNGPEGSYESANATCIFGRFAAPGSG